MRRISTKRNKSNIEEKKITKIEKVSSSKVDNLVREVDLILGILGHPESMVTDESLIWDFLDIFDKKQANRDLQILSRKLGFEVDDHDYLWEVAEKIKSKKE